ncbi:MAG TPA: WD40 repeat domain-containing protein [Candidatus Methylacidiphilales bacterium]|nr:WD40 repeat domain-containing protein [Candidatus Methylacidiphilales bacterium]
MRNVLQISLRAWEESGRRPNFLLPPGKSLNQARELLAADPENITGSLRTFIELSASNAKSRRRSRQFWVACLAVPVLAVLVGVMYWSNLPGGPVGPGIHLDEGVRTAIFSPDSSRVAAASVTNRICLWDPVRGTPLTETLIHPQVSLVDFNPGGTLMLTAGRDGTARVWDATTGNSLLKPLDHHDVITVAMFSPDGNSILTGSEGKKVILWNPSTGQRRVAPLQHSAEIRTAAYSLDGRQFVTTATDNTIRVWNATTGAPVGKVMSSDQELRSASFNADATRIISISTLGTAIIWDIGTGQPVQNLNQSLSVAISADGKRLVAGDRLGAQIYDTTTGQPIGPRMTHEGGAIMVAFSPRGDLVFTGSNQATGYTWKTDSGQLFGRFSLPRFNLLYAQFSPDGTRLLTTSGKGPNAVPVPDAARPPVSLQTNVEPTVPEGIALLWLTDGSSLGRPMRCSPDIEHFPVIFSPDGTRILTVIDKEVIVRDAGASHIAK